MTQQPPSHDTAGIEDLSTERGHRTLAIVRKGGKHVIIPIAPRTGRALDLYIGERTMGPIFLGVEGGRMDRYCADRMVKRLVKRAGIDKRISPHSLRHSFITAALDAGVPLRDVQEAASHADPRTTMRYDRARRSLDRHATYIVATVHRRSNPTHLITTHRSSNQYRAIGSLVTPAVRRGVERYATDYPSGFGSSRPSDTCRSRAGARSASRQRHCTFPSGGLAAVRL